MEILLLAISAKAAKLILSYGICFAIILFGLILLALFKHRTKKEMRPQTIKACCQKAKKYAETLMAGREKRGALLLASTKGMKLTAMVEEAAWLAFQVVEAKKDLVYEGLAGSLDGLATKLGNDFMQGYISAEEYERDLQTAINGLDAAVLKLNTLIK